MWAGFQIFNNKSVTPILIRRLKAATSIMAEWRLSSKIIEMLLYFNSSFIQVHISEVCEAFHLDYPFHQRGGKHIPNWIEPRALAVITISMPGCCIQLVRRSNFTPHSNEMLLTVICECKTAIFHDSKRAVDAAGCNLHWSKPGRQMAVRVECWQTGLSCNKLTGEWREDLTGQEGGNPVEKFTCSRENSGKNCCQRPSCVLKAWGAYIFVTAFLFPDSYCMTA